MYPDAWHAGWQLCAPFAAVFHFPGAGRRAMPAASPQLPALPPALVRLVGRAPVVAAAPVLLGAIAPAATHDHRVRVRLAGVSPGNRPAEGGLT